jgi:hypothetical protein
VGANIGERKTRTFAAEGAALSLIDKRAKQPREKDEKEDEEMPWEAHLLLFASRTALPALVATALSIGLS